MHSIILPDRIVSARELNCKVSLLSEKLSALPQAYLILSDEDAWYTVLMLLAGIQTNKHLILLNHQVKPKQIERLLEHHCALVTMEHTTAEHWSNICPVSFFVEPGEIEESNLIPTLIPVCSQAFLVFKTSGTTSDLEKYVELPASWLLKKSAFLGNTIGISNEDVGIVFSSFSFIQVVWTVLMHLLCGASLVLTQFVPSKIMDLCNVFGVSTIVTTPSVIRGLMETSKMFPTSLRNIVTGGDLMDRSTLLRLKQLLPYAWYTCVYGCTETSAANIVSTPIALSDYRECDESIGKPAPENDIKVLPKSGEICIRTSFSPGCYLGDSGSFLDAEGFFHTGDIGRVESDGSITFMGRSSSKIICNGRKFWANEVEAALNQIPFVIESAVIPVSHSIYGQVPTAYVVTSTTVSSENLISSLKTVLEPYKIPRKFFFVPFLPKTISGKILRGEKQYEQFQ